ncbi:hypothetical protein GCM10010278_37220 [Streptomyces melanogenes]|nr:hypothetical protein GCM10010278_37220 [Streptomyces melanogenes]
MRAGACTVVKRRALRPSCGEKRTPGLEMQHHAPVVALQAREWQPRLADGPGTRAGSCPCGQLMDHPRTHEEQREPVPLAALAVFPDASWSLTRCCPGLRGFTGRCVRRVGYRYIPQGRAEVDRPVTTPRWLGRLLLTHPDHLRDRDASLLAELTSSCPKMTQLASFIREFAQLLTSAAGDDEKLAAWIVSVRTAQLPCLHAFANGLELDRAAVTAGLTLPHHNGRTKASTPAPDES